MAAGGARLANGVSATRESPAGLPEAYHEARAAIESLGLDGGVLALQELSAFECLTMHVDSTAARLICPPIRRFVDEDIACGGRLTGTLLACASMNLNARVAPQRTDVRPRQHRLPAARPHRGEDRL